MEKQTIKSIIVEHLWFYLAASIFIMVALIIGASIDKGDEILFFSQRRTPFFNLVFCFATKMGEYYAYLVALAILLFVQYRKALMLPLIGIVGGYGSVFLKKLFLQPRPYDFFTQIGKWEEIVPVEGAELLTGLTSFPSGHTCSGFALISYVAICLKKSLALDLILFLFAMLVALSRVYLVQHFLFDIAVGAFLGLMVGLGAFHLQEQLKGAFKGIFDQHFPGIKAKNPRV